MLSDKTGTLTRNQMEFFKCSIGGISYGTGVTEVERAAAERTGVQLDAYRLLQSERPLEKGYNLRDPRLEGGRWRQEPQAAIIARFLQVLSLCHTVVPEGEEEPEAVRYLAESPDEAAFVVAAKRLGFFFHRRQAGRVTVREGGAEREYAVLQTLAFSSARKRMSVVVKDPEGRVLLLCKGADSVVLERLSPEGSSLELRQRTQEHLTEYAEAGLRTLAIAWKLLEPAQYAEWQQRWQRAKEQVGSAALQAQALDELAEEMERGLQLAGATAIEDKLQVGVPQTIDALARAGIRLWVLTGDKLETAVNIGYACSLLRHSMTQHLIYLEDNTAVQAEAHRAGLSLEEYSRRTVGEQLRASRAAAELGARAQSHALVIDGRSLAHVLRDEALRAEFLEASVLCESVICCRVSPIQKAQVTELVRQQGKQVCLAVGDGANDVGMIQKANIGVGISGEEGNQAVMASDFSIGQFRFLERLLLVHGAWSYRRIAFMVNFFFYKNFVYGFTVLYYNAGAHFSGASVYYDWYLSLYNVVFSAFPICVVACIDQDVRADLHLRFPRLYRVGQRNANFSVARIALWLLNGVYQVLSALCSALLCSLSSCSLLCSLLCSLFIFCSLPFSLLCSFSGLCSTFSVVSALLVSLLSALLYPLLCTALDSDLCPASFSSLLSALVSALCSAPMLLQSSALLCSFLYSSALSFSPLVVSLHSALTWLVLLCSSAVCGHLLHDPGSLLAGE